MSGIIGSKLNIRGSGRIAKLGTDGQVLTSSGAGVAAAFEDASAGGTSWQSVETGATFTAVAGNGYPVNTTAQACTVTLPAGSVGDTIELVDYAGTWDTNRVTITADGSEKIKGGDDDVQMKKEREGVRLVYVDATQGWVAATAANDGTSVMAPNKDIEFMVVGAGGAGGRGGNGEGSGAGGAGGYRSTSAEPGSAAVLTITVGDGAANVDEWNTIPNRGGPSSVSGTGLTTITASGGGSGVPGGGSPSGGDQTGGSGGGGNGYLTVTAGAGNVGGDLDGVPEGYAGGDGLLSINTGGGGGGASEVGDAGNVSAPPDGGDGVQNDIIEDGVDVYYAGGGGGGNQAEGGGTGSGGQGGGGNGARNGTAQQGTDGLGGGGGGNSSNQVGGDGGDGIVVLRIPTAIYSDTSSGSPTITTDGDYKVLKYLGDGTYTTVA